MGLNLALVAVEGEAIDRVLETLRGQLDEPEMSLDLLQVDPVVDMGVGQHRGWTVLVDTLMIVLAQPESIALLSQGGRAYAAIWDSTSDTYGFSAYEDGDVTRELVHQMGEVAVDEGSPLEAEEGLEWEMDPEEALQQLVERTTDIAVLTQDFLEIPMRPFQMAG